MTSSKKHTPELHDADVIDVVSDTDLEPVESISVSATDQNRQKHVRLYLLLPCIFLTVTLLGGLRLATPDNSFVFLKPALLCLIFALVLLVLFVRGGLIALDEWVNEQFPILTNIANSIVLLTLFGASAQIFNSVVPEQGFSFWVVAFCFLWTLWNNLFADFDTKKLLRSIFALFGFAFVAKYLILANLTAPASESWLRGLIENPAQEAFTWILALPKYSIVTGYIQFFTVLLYFLGLLLLPRSTRLNKLNK